MKGFCCLGEHTVCCPVQKQQQLQAFCEKNECVHCTSTAQNMYPDPDLILNDSQFSF